MCRFLQLACCAAVLLIAGAHAAYATTARLASHAELVRLADAVIIAHAQDARSYWQGTRIFTRHSVVIEESLKGSLQAGSDIPVDTLGGVADGIGQKVSGAAQLPSRQRLVLYLVETGNAVWRCVGMWQGVFRVAGDDHSAGIVRQPADVRIVGPSALLPSNLVDLRRELEQVHGER